MSTVFSIYEAVKRVISELESHKDITIDKAQFNPAPSSEELNREVKVPQILREFYKHANGVELAWHVTDDPSVRGSLVMPLIEKIHDTRWQSFGVLDYTDDVHAVFQKRDSEDSRVIAESLLGDEDIEFQEIAGGIITIRGYFEAFEKTRGYRFWQESYNPQINYTIESIIKNRAYLFADKESEDLPELHSAHIPN